MALICMFYLFLEREPVGKKAQKSESWNLAGLGPQAVDFISPSLNFLNWKTSLTLFVLQIVRDEHIKDAPGRSLSL